MAGSRAQQAAIAISMKKAGKKPKMQTGGRKKPYTLDPGFSKVTPENTRNIDPGFYRKPDSTSLTRISGKKLKFDKDGKVLYKKGGSTPAWQRKEGKSPSGGLNAKGRASLKAAGHDIKAPQPEGGPRKRSFCARMSGMKKKLTSAKTANDPNSRINKSLRKWKC